MHATPILEGLGADRVRRAVEPAVRGVDEPPSPREAPWGRSGRSEPADREGDQHGEASVAHRRTAAPEHGGLLLGVPGQDCQSERYRVSSGPPASHGPEPVGKELAGRSNPEFQGEGGGAGGGGGAGASGLFESGGWAQPYGDRGLDVPRSA